MPDLSTLPGAGMGPGLDEQVLAKIASAMFAALPGAAPEAVASPPALGGYGASPQLPDVPALIDPQPVAAPDADPASLAPYATAPLPGATPPQLASPPALGGFGASPRFPDVPTLALPLPGFGITAPATSAPTTGVGATTPTLAVAGLTFADDPWLGSLDQAPPAPSGAGKGIDALPVGNADKLYFLTGEALPALTDIQPLNPFAAPVSPALPASVPVSEGLTGYDVRRYRADFPILSERVNGGKPLVWLDNGATTQKPRAVIDRLTCFYEHENSNIHRAAHELAARSTDAYEGAREKVRCFLGAENADSIVFTRGTTESINLVAQSWGRQNLKAGDAIILSQLEHHANIVPWVRLSQELGFEIRIAPVDDRGDIRLDEYGKLLAGRVKFVGFTQVSNALGTVTPAKAMIEMAHAAGAVVLLDGAQSVSHMPLNLTLLDPDFFVFSGHKIYGPTGIGALYGRPALLDSMPPWQGGGNMIEDVTFEHIRYHGAPMKFEAGTGNIADAVGLGAALDYVMDIGREAICAHEHMLIAYTEMQLRQISGLKLIGEPVQRAGVVSFVMDQHSVPAIGQALSREGIAVRAGHHCAQPILRRMGVEATVRPSFGLYNALGDVDALIRVLRTL